jgi:hypothetical protein
MKKSILLLIGFISFLGTSQTDIKKTVGEFSEIKTYDLINLTMIKSNENKVIISGKNKNNVRVVNKNGKLKIRMNVEEAYDGNDTQITLYFTSVDIIDANEGSEITVTEPIKQFEVNLKAQEGGRITAKVNTTYTNIKAVTGGVINLKGTSKKQEVTIFTGGVYNAQEFITEFTEVSINAAGDARVNASEKVDVKIRAGGDVYIYGNPKIIDEKRVLGGRVKRM